MEIENNHKVLIIGSESEEVSFFENALEYLDVDFFRTEGADVVLKISKVNYSLVLLFEVFSLPGSFEICRQIRDLDPHIFISYIASFNDPFEKILAFELGIDQLIQLPISEAEILSRLRSQLRRIDSLFNLERNQSAGRISVNNLTIDTSKKEVYLVSRLLPLTPSEYKIVEILALSPGQTLSRSAIAHRLWGFDSEVYEENVKYHVSRIRKKIEEDPENPVYIKTVRGRGYRMLDA